MANEIIERENSDVIFDITSIAKQLETATGVKLKLANLIDPEYIAIGQITEQQLKDFGFEFVSYSSYIKCPIYRYGANIEAIFNESILHIYDLRK